jgi:hypothetical protein
LVTLRLVAPDRTVVAALDLAAARPKIHRQIKTERRIFWLAVSYL